MHGPVHKSELNFSYSRKHFNQLPQEFCKGLINNMSHKVSYGSMIIDTVINGFSPNKLRSHLQICDH